MSAPTSDGMELDAPHVPPAVPASNCSIWNCEEASCCGGDLDTDVMMFCQPSSNLPTRYTPDESADALGMSGDVNRSGLQSLSTRTAMEIFTDYIFHTSAICSLHNVKNEEGAKAIRHVILDIIQKEVQILQALEQVV